MYSRKPHISVLIPVFDLAPMFVWLTSGRDMAEKFPDAEVIGVPAKYHTTGVHINRSTQEPISLQLLRMRSRAKISTSRLMTAVATGSTL